MSQWGTGLFQCMVDTTQCVDTACCALCALSRQWKAAEGITNQLDIPMCVIAYFCGYCMNCALRRKVVEKYNIDEAPVVSIVTAWICGGCSLCQTHRELTIRNAWPGGTVCHKQPGDYSSMK